MFATTLNSSHRHGQLKQIFWPLKLPKCRFEEDKFGSKKTNKLLHAYNWWSWKIRLVLNNIKSVAWLRFWSICMTQPTLALPTCYGLYTGQSAWHNKHLLYQPSMVFSLVNLHDTTNTCFTNLLWSFHWTFTMVMPTIVFNPKGPTISFQRESHLLTGWYSLLAACTLKQVKMGHRICPKIPEALRSGAIPSKDLANL